MKWNPSNREWYISKGYNYTHWHDEFEVKIEDLSATSQAILEFKCDYCDKHHIRTYDRYIKRYRVNPSGKHSCNDCNDLRLEENKVTQYVDVSRSNHYEKHYRVVIDSSDIFIKCCKRCNKYKELTCFKESNQTINLEYSNQCIECDKDIKELNLFKFRVRHIKETSVKMNLPIPMTDKELERIYEIFDEKCALSKSININCEHFIPVSWGHGGTYVGNVYLLSQSLNYSKGNLNPFKWIKRPNIKKTINQKEWKSLIKYLAAKNKMTMVEFEQYVYWCEKNKRTAEEVRRDGGITSMELWKISKVK